MARLHCVRRRHRAARQISAFLILIVFAMGMQARAEADNSGYNVLAGPVLGISWGGSSGRSLLLGLEGGVGWGPERLNVGVSWRDKKVFGYAELDLWLLLGVSLGAGVDSHGEVQPVLGVWEGIPLDNECGRGQGDSWNRQSSLAVGYRFSGVHELYVTLKSGLLDGCWVLPGAGS